MLDTLFMPAMLMAALMSPRQAEVFSGRQMIQTPSFASAIIVPPPVGKRTNYFAWTASADATGYILYQRGGGITNKYLSAVTQATAVYDWPDNVMRWEWTVTATNDWGESDPSKTLTLPPPPPTHLVLSWPGGASTSVSNSTAIPPVWSRLTNSASPVTLRITGGARYFAISGTNRLTITATNL